MNEGFDDDYIAQAISETIFNKPSQHHFADTSGETALEQHVMSQIGG